MNLFQNRHIRGFKFTGNRNTGKMFAEYSGESMTKIGDPANLNTTLGPIGTKQNLKSLRDKVRDAIKNTDCEILYGEIDY